MEKLFKSKIAFVVFVIGFTSLLLIVYKAPAARVINSLAMGALTGFVFAQWYWKDKMDKIQHLIDARMPSPEQTELLKRKEDELFEAANRNTKLVDRIGELQNEIELLKIPLNKVREKFKCLTIIDSPETESVTFYFYPVVDGSEENKSFSKYTPTGQLILTVSYENEAHKFFTENEEYYLDLIKSKKQ